MSNKLLYQAPASSFSPSFWEELYRLKLNVLKLDDSEQPLRCLLLCSDGRRPESVQFSAESHHAGDASSTMGCTHGGVVINVNTVEVSLKTRINLRCQSLKQ